MEKLKFKITKNTLTISLMKSDAPKENLNNTNIIDTSEIIFSKSYIYANLELVVSFLNVVLIKKEVNRAIITNNDILMVSMKVINEIPSILKLEIKPQKTITYNIFLLILENNHLKELTVYDMPPYLLERLDVNKDLIVNLKSEMFFISNFMEENNLNTYSNLYYKKTINISKDFDKYDLEDFKTFLNINHHLKTINLIHFSYIDLNYILDLILDLNLTNIKIVINEKDNDLKLIFNSVDALRKKYEKIFKKRNINLKINYSLEYKKNNIFKQLNLNFIKYSLSTLIVLIFILMGLNIYKNYKQENDILLIEQELQDIISQIDREYNLDDQDSEIEYIVPDDDDNLEETTTAPKNNYVSSYYKNYEKVFDTLLNINSDTKGWITVNNTRIDYPVVQAKDNEYYLKRDFNKHRNSMGWVFMDYRNDIDILNQNTIIYGHNINGGIMFGTLRYALNKNWSQKDENRIITFNTLNSSMKWKIFSIYRIPNTTDYLYTTFYDHDKYQAFLDLITERSIYDFEEELDTSDKILTLSTCHDRGKDRIVLHAKLIKE